MKLKDLPIGTIVKDSNSKYNGKVMLWYVAEKYSNSFSDTHVTYPSNSVLLLSIDFLCQKPWNKGNWKKNYIIDSAIRPWLNRADLDSTYNENGFLSYLSQEFTNNLLNISISNRWGSIASDRIILPSYAEMGIAHDFVGEGKRFSLLSQNLSLNRVNGYTLTRSDNDTDPGNITPNGTRQFNGSTEASTVIRPICCLKEDVDISIDTANGHYFLFKKGSNMQFKINGSKKLYSEGWVKVDGQKKVIASIKTKINGLLKDV